jgi:hypothetical protein
MIVAIHQPNYVPWLGYFSKIAHADAFIFLDDAQYTTNSYINRAQIDAAGVAKWLTVPVSYSLGDPIARVRTARADWTKAHLDALRTWYRGAAAFRDVAPWIESVYAGLPSADLAASNMSLIQAIAARLGLERRFHRASALGASGLSGDVRLAALVAALDAGGTYLSGRGGAKYQSEANFAAAGIALRYTDFELRSYDQRRPAFLPGLSILDALFRLGWDATAALLMPAPASSPH